MFSSLTAGGWTRLCGITEPESACHLAPSHVLPVPAPAHPGACGELVGRNHELFGESNPGKSKECVWSYCRELALEAHRGRGKTAWEAGGKRGALFPLPCFLRPFFFFF